MYSKQFWMFCVLLLVITLLSSIGGGIRYRENFLEEVFDLNDITSELDGTNTYYSPIIDIPEEQPLQQPVPKKIEEEVVEQVPVKLPEVNGVSKLNNAFEIIEPYFYILILSFTLNGLYTVYNSYLLYFKTAFSVTVINASTTFPIMFYFTFIQSPLDGFDLVIGVLICYCARIILTRIYLLKIL